MYEQRIDRQHPGAIVFLVDQSESMGDGITGMPLTKATTVADQLNGLLFELVQRCTKAIGEPPRPYFAVAIIGYGTDQNGNPLVGSVLQGALADDWWAWTTDLAQHPLRIEERERAVEGAPPQKYVMPVWVDPFAGGGTPMCTALDNAGRLVRAWCDEYPAAFPPIVINLSDGESTDGSPSQWADRLRSLHTDDGNVLFFNLGIGGDDKMRLFDERAPSTASPHTMLLWEMSSELPEFMIEVARSQGFQISPGARGFGANADFRNVVSFLNVGTSVGHLLR
ncbi:MAG: VWA domain-containing protein [Acidimicrobiia bacterium]|nr:VWA domain-containing protein [Acidimicrobiia bacterium]